MPNDLNFYLKLIYNSLKFTVYSKIIFMLYVRHYKNLYDCTWFLHMIYLIILFLGHNNFSYYFTVNGSISLVTEHEQWQNFFFLPF